MGHGARSAVAFVFLLKQARIQRLIDVRTYPVSRRHPHFSREPLAASVCDAGIAYEWQGKALGGMRKDGYGVHMQTPLFVTAAAALIDASRAQRVCIRCAEADPGNCHRSYISDWLVAHGERVLHLLEPEKVHEHAARLF